MKIATEELHKLLGDDDGSRIAIDGDGDAYLLPSGLPNNLLALPARDDDGNVLNVLQWKSMVARFDAAPTLAAELIPARAKLEAAEKLAKALDALIDGRNWVMSTEKFIAAKAALAAWEAAQ